MILQDLRKRNLKLFYSRRKSRFMNTRYNALGFITRYRETRYEQISSEAADRLVVNMLHMPKINKMRKRYNLIDYWRKYANKI
jgi:hypothetical protein